MKKVLCLSLMMAYAMATHAQELKVTRNWTAITQLLDASFVKDKLKFKASVSMKVLTADTTGYASVWVGIYDKEDKYLAGKGTDKATSAAWKTYTFEGEIPENAFKILLLASCSKDGKFYFDNFEFLVQDNKGNFRKAILNNPDFEAVVADNKVPYWMEGTTGKFTERVKGYSLISDPDHVSGNYSLLIEGKNTVRDSTYLIGTAKGFTPQIAALVGMLNNMSARVERDVIALNQKEADHLMDNKANTIGALIMHLAAAEVYYQVYTFEHRGFNEEEKKKWQVALDLGEEARKTIKGHDVEYYLNIYREVRKKTLDEFRKRNDDFLFEPLGGSSDYNNYWAWFHMAEHQSSHLGQMRIVKKRLPKREEKLLPVAIETNH